MRQSLLRTDSLTTLSAATVYCCLLAPHAAASSVVDTLLVPCSSAGSLENLSVELSAAPGSGVSVTFTVQKNGVDTALTATISDLATVGQFTSSAVSVIAGDSLALKVVRSGAAFDATMYWSVDFVSSDNTSIYGTDQSLPLSRQYVDPFGGVSDSASLDATVVMPVGGDITALAGTDYIDPIGATNVLHVYVNKNGVRQDGSGGTVDTRLVVGSISAGQAAVRTFTLPVSRGDLIYLEQVIPGTFDGGSATSLCMTFRASQTGASVLAGGGSNLGNNSIPTYGFVNRATSTWRSVIDSFTARKSGVTGIRVSDLIVVSSVAPGSGQTRTIEVLSDTVLPSGTPAVTVADAATTAEDTTNEYVFGPGVFVGPLRLTNSASAAAGAGRVYGSMVAVADTVSVPTFGSVVSVAQFGLGGSLRKLCRDYNAVRVYPLGDMGVTNAVEDVAAASGTYNHTPAKTLGILPEWGPSTSLDGAAHYVSVTSGLASGQVPFSISAMIRPRAIGQSVVVATGASGTGAILGLTSAGHARFGSAATQSSGGPLVSALDEKHLVGVYDGTYATLYVNGDRVAGPTAVTISGHGNGRVGAIGSAEFFGGDVQMVAFFDAALTSSGVTDLWNAARWWDLSDDLRDSVAIVVDAGIHSDSPVDRMARTGTMTFALNNGANNSAGRVGYYSPGHANARSGWDRGAFTRFGVTIQGSAPKVLFTGKVKSIKPTAGQWDERIVQVVATDWMDEAARVSMRGLGLETSQNATMDDALTMLVNALRNKPHGVDFAAGSEAWPVVFDYAGDGKATVQSELKRIIDSEAGWIYVRGDGTLVAQSRSSRSGAATAVATFANTMTELEADRNTDQLVNWVEVTVTPRRVDTSDVVLYSIDGPVEIVNGVTATLSLDYRDPNNENQKISGLNVSVPAPTTDYTINTASDGSGVDLTTDPNIVLTWVPEANGMRLTVTNNYGAAAYFTTLQVQGRGLYTYTPLTFIAKDIDSIDDDGVRDVTFSMPYQSSGPIGESVGALMLNSYALMPTRVRTLKFKPETDQTLLDAFSALEIGARVEVTETVTGVAASQYLVNAMKFEWGQARDISVTLVLVPADTQTYWTFDASAFDATTRFSV